MESLLATGAFAPAEEVRKRREELAVTACMVTVFVDVLGQYFSSPVLVPYAACDCELRQGMLRAAAALQRTMFRRSWDKEGHCTVFETYSLACGMLQRSTPSD